MKRSTHAAFKEKALSKRGVKVAYDELEEEFTLISELIHARKIAKKSQADIAKAMKTTTSAISRLESANNQNYHSPSLSTLRRYAKALGCRIRIKLIPESRYV